MFSDITFNINRAKVFNLIPIICGQGGKGLKSENWVCRIHLAVNV